MSKDPVQAAAEAHTDLSMFGAIVSILEGGHIYCPSSHRAVEQIVRICQREQANLLRLYDTNAEKAKSSHDQR